MLSTNRHFNNISKQKVALQEKQDDGMTNIINLPSVSLQQLLSHHRPLVPMPDDMETVSKVYMFEIKGKQALLIKMNDGNQFQTSKIKC